MCVCVYECKSMCVYIHTQDNQKHDYLLAKLYVCNNVCMCEYVCAYVKCVSNMQPCIRKSIFIRFPIVKHTIYRSTSLPPKFCAFVTRHKPTLQLLLSYKPALLFDHFHFFLDHEYFLNGMYVSVSTFVPGNFF